MRDWIWVTPADALIAHDEQLAEHGGASGVRDPAMLESAMARPLNLVAYGAPDIADWRPRMRSGSRATTRSSTETSGRRRS